MNKSLRISSLAVAALLTITQVGQAATVSKPPVNTSAIVTSTLQLNMNLFKNSISAANDITASNAMAFGTLQNTTGTLRSHTSGSTGTASVIALLSAASSGPYTISQTGTAMTSGTNTLPAGACTVVPVYSPADNNGAANVGTLGTAGTWVTGSAKTIYQSNAAGAIQQVQAHYSITDDPAAGATSFVPVNQPAGTYSGTVTFSVTA